MTCKLLIQQTFYYSVVALLTFGCASTPEPESDVKQLINSVIQETQINDMGKTTPNDKFSITKDPRFKKLDLSQITEIRDEDGADGTRTYYMKNKLVILGTEFKVFLGATPQLEKEAWNAIIPKRVKPYCNFTNDKACNCYFWQDMNNRFSGHCLSHGWVEKENSIYIDAFFLALSQQDAKIALKLIRSMPNELYSIDNTNASVKYLFNAEEREKSTFSYIAGSNCSYLISYKNFMQSLSASQETDFNHEKLIGYVSFQNELGTYHIDDNLRVKSLKSGKIWRLKQAFFEKKLLFQKEISRDDCNKY